MKKIYFGAAVLFIGLSSCSTSDDANNGSTSNFLPLTETSEWVYDVSLDSENIGRDSLYVNGETTINGAVYKKMNTKSTPTGFYTSILNNNSVRKSTDQLLLSGNSGLGLIDFLPISIELSDFVIFKENAANNQELSLVSGTIEQDVQNIPLKIEYKLRSFFKETLSSFTVPGKESYSNVKVIQVKANLTVSTVYLLPIINTPITVTLLPAQDVVISTNYYAEGVGMIYSKTNIDYQLNDVPQGGINLPIPQQGSSTIEEFLD